MEKFTKWSDKSGVNPFVPCKPKLPKSFITRILYISYISVIAFPKLLIALLLAILIFIARIVLSPFGIIIIAAFSGIMEYYHNSETPSWITLGSLSIALISIGEYSGIWTPSFLLLRMLVHMITPLVLGLCGVQFVPQLGSYRRLGLDTTLSSKSKLEDLTYAAGGHVILCNLTNCLEVLYLERFCRPVFVFTYKISRVSAATTTPTTGCHAYLCVSAGLYRALWLAAYSNAGDPVPSDARPLSDMVQYSRLVGRPIVLFPEGARTNGDGVLEFPSQLFESLIIGTGSSTSTPLPSIHLTGFLYPSPDKLSPATPVGSPLAKLFWLSGSSGWGWGPLFTVPLCCVPAQMIKNPLVGPATRGDESGHHIRKSSQQLVAYINQLRDLFAQLVRKNKVALNIDDLISFRKYYILLNSGNNKEANVFADERKKH